MSEQRGDTSAGAASGGAGRGTYDERLRVPLWWWPLSLVVGLALASEIPLRGSIFVQGIPYAAVAVGVAALLLWAGRVRVRVAAGELHVDDAHVPLHLLGSAEALDAHGKAHALGPELDPLAFLVLRPWVRGAVLVVLDDTSDPTPYWLVSSRRPDRLVAALSDAQD